MTVERGLRNAWFTALSVAGIYRRLGLLERRLDIPVPDVTVDPAFRVALLMDGERAAYLEFRPDQDVVEVTRRLDRGDHCFATWQEQRIVHAAWAATGRAWIEYVSRELPLAADDVYVYDSFTTPEFRGRGAAPLRARVLGQYFAARGYARLLTAVLQENAAGFRPLEKVGTRPVGTIGYIGIGPWRRHFVRRRPR